eukprot:12920540-Prorocentrum_lima.AAC.1
MSRTAALAAGLLAFTPHRSMKLAGNPRTSLSSCEFKAGTLSSTTSVGNVSLTFAKLHSRLQHTIVRFGCFDVRSHE